MDGHGVVTVIACAGHLAFGTLAFQRRSRSALGGLIALLFFDAFAWNFASLAYELSGQRLYNLVDHFFSTLMAAIALHVVVVFVGRSKQLRLPVIAAYALFGSIGLFATSTSWWKLLAVLGPACMAFAIGLLLVHRRRTPDAAERARSELILLAISVGTLLSSTDLWYRETSLPVPRLGAIGTLIAMALFALAALRLSLLGREVPRVLALYALLLGAFWVVAHLAIARWLDARSSPWVLGGMAFLLVAVAATRELGRLNAVGRARTVELATLGRFSEQLAHDIRNPLSALKGALQFLQQEHEAGRSLDAQTPFLKLMLEQVERMQRVVADYQRIGKVEPSVAPLSLNALVRGVLPLQRFGLPAGIAIEAELSPDLPECPLDRDLVVTALENVLRNACEAMPKGGTIVVRTARDEDAGIVSVGVEDQGQGMDPRELESATALFFTTKAQGTGLGLSFAERVAKAHGGGLLLRSVLGRGTTVTLSFSERSGARA
jgi:signal transduction histidine kinase